MSADRVPDGWRLVKLGDLGEVNRGRSRHRPRHAAHLYGGPYPFIQTGDIAACGGRVGSYQQTYTEAGLAQSRLWPVGTMCITIAANIAETGILMFPACFPDSVVGFVADQTKCDVRFIEYTFRHLRRQIQHEASGSVQDNINLGTLDRLRFPLPPLSVQHAIAEILGALDDKIDVNRKLNQTLEAIAQALFRSWFVDFDPVIAKRDGRKPGRMDSEIAALFPAHFQESELGPIPQGWAVFRLSEFVEVVDCLHSKKPDRVAEPGFVLLQLANIVDLGLLDMSDRYFISADDYARWTKNIEVREGDCVITNVGRVGAVAQVPPEGRYALGRNMTGLRCRDALAAPAFLVTLLLSDVMRDEIDLNTDSGTILDALNVRSIGSLRFAADGAPVIRRFESIARPLRAQMESNCAETKTLAGLHDTLLPRLLSGEIRLKDAEKLVGEAV